MPDSVPPSGRAVRRPRADALRNRERVLAVARDAFATDGPSISLDEIARRAGLGAGTVHRHFPTKQELLAAVIAERLAGLAEDARRRAEARDAGQAFFDFFRQLVDSARDHLALTAAFTTADDVADSVRDAGGHLAEALRVLLERAQRLGAVRTDVGIGELHAIIAGTLVMEQRLPTPAARGRGVAVVLDGLRPQPDANRARHADH
ncbi:TetR/AcrR family transcriptional regulator [Actinophytocola sp.]|uniref:TetR/AcrR family transcriptional regulator n=1 Tax=Actinophytocola sp. TaxID=1872138 RepID=UPI00389AA357